MTTKGLHTHFTNLACNIPTENFFCLFCLLGIFSHILGIPGTSREIFGNSRGNSMESPFRLTKKKVLKKKFSAGEGRVFRFRYANQTTFF